MLEAGNLTSKVTRLVGRLRERNVDCRTKLMAQWQTEKTYLQEELLAWYKADAKTELKAHWKSITDTR